MLTLRNLAAALLLSWMAAPLLHASATKRAADDRTAPPVTLTDEGTTWTMDNGIVHVTVQKNSGLMTSLIYRGYDTGSHGIWEHTPQGAPQVSNTVTIDPKSDDGERAEVSIKGIGGGTYMFSAHAPGGGTLCDIELRYSLARGDHGVYTYAIFDHPASYPAAGVGAEDRFIDEMSQHFDWITVDKDRNMLEAAPADWGAGVVVHAKEQRILSTGVYKNSVEHKYSYSGVQFDDDQNKLRLGSFYVMGLFAGREFRHGLTGYIAAENLLNRRYVVTLTGNPSNPLQNWGPPILARVGLRFEFPSR